MYVSSVYFLGSKVLQVGGEWSFQGEGFLCPGQEGEVCPLPRPFQAILSQHWTSLMPLLRVASLWYRPADHWTQRASVLFSLLLYFLPIPPSLPLFFLPLSLFSPSFLSQADLEITK